MLGPTRPPDPVRLVSVLDHFGAGNIGDDLMLEGLLAAAEAASSRDLAFELAIPCPHRVLSQLRRFPQVLWCRPGPGYQAAVRFADALMLPGATPFMPERWIWDRAPGRLYLGAGRPLFCIGVGADATAERQAPEAAELLRRAALTTTRDATSLEILQALVPDRADRFAEGADLANIALGRLFRHPGKPLGERAIPLAMLWYVERPCEAEVEALRTFLAARDGPPPVFLSHEARGPYELARFRRLYPRGAARARFIRPPYYATTVAELVDVYREVGTVVSSRYHSLLAAAWAGCRVAALPRSLTIAGLARALDIPLAPAPLTAEALTGSLEAARRVPRARLEALAERAMRTSVDVLAEAGALALESRPPVRRRRSASERRRLLLVRQDSIGDVVMSTAMLRELRRSFPDAELTLVVSTATRPLFQYCPYVDRLIGYDFSEVGGFAARSGLAAEFAARRLRPLRFNAALLPRYDFDHWGGRAMVEASGASVRIGYAAGLARESRYRREVAPDPFTLTLAPDDVRHEVERTLAVVEAGGGSVVDRRLELWPAPAARERAVELLGPRKGAKLVALAPGAAHPRRVWPQDRFAAVARRVADSIGACFVVVGGDQERGAGAAIASALGGAAIDLTGRLTLNETFAAIEACDLLISNDSAPIHLASAAGTPVVEISPHPLSGDPNASMSPLRFGPWMTEARVLQPQAPRDACLETCKAREAHCILEISVEAVAAAALDLMAAA